jgi:hypothetical protein
LLGLWRRTCKTICAPISRPRPASDLSCVLVTACISRLLVAVPLLSKKLHFSFRKPPRASCLRDACASSPTTTFRGLLPENRRVLLSRECVHLTSARCCASPCEEAPHLANEICHAFPNPRSSLVLSKVLRIRAKCRSPQFSHFAAFFLERQA